MQLPSARRCVALRLPLDQPRHEVEAIPVRLQVDPFVVLLSARARFHEDPIIVAVIASRVQRRQAAGRLWLAVKRHTPQQTVVGRDRMDAQTLMRLDGRERDLLVADIS